MERRYFNRPYEPVPHKSNAAGDNSSLKKASSLNRLSNCGCKPRPESHGVPTGDVRRQEDDNDENDQLRVQLASLAVLCPCKHFGLGHPVH